MERIEIDSQKKLQYLLGVISDSSDCLTLDKARLLISIVQDIEPDAQKQVSLLVTLRDHRGHRRDDAQQFIRDYIAKLLIEISQSES